MMPVKREQVPYVERLTLALILPRFVIIGHMALIGGLGMMIVSVVGFMHHTSTPANPFALYADMMPGQPAAPLSRMDFNAGCSTTVSTTRLKHTAECNRKLALFPALRRCVQKQ